MMIWKRLVAFSLVLALSLSLGATAFAGSDDEQDEQPTLPLVERITRMLAAMQAMDAQDDAADVAAQAVSPLDLPLFSPWRPAETAPLSVVPEQAAASQSLITLRRAMQDLFTPAHPDAAMPTWMQQLHKRLIDLLERTPDHLE